MTAGTAVGKDTFTYSNGNRLDLDLPRLLAALGATGGYVYKRMLRIVAKAENYSKQRCPVDTGNLRSSINSRVEVDFGKNTMVGLVGTTVEYAPYVEFGARGRAPVGYLRGGAEQAIQEETGNP